MQLSATRFDKRKGHILVMSTQKHVSDIDSNCNVLFDNILNIRTVNWLFVLYIYISESYVPLARRWHVFDLIAKNVCCVRYQWYTETVIMHNICIRFFQAYLGPSKIEKYLWNMGIYLIVFKYRELVRNDAYLKLKFHDYGQITTKTMLSASIVSRADISSDWFNLAFSPLGIN